MECEFSVELGVDDPTLAVPWRSPDGTVAFVDLRSHPERIAELQEVRDFPELADALRALNNGQFATAKCDAWFDTLMDVDDEPYGAVMKCGSYIDLFFTGEKQFAPFAEHESAARGIVRSIRERKEDAARASVNVRRAYFGEDAGFYWTVYVFGYGDDAGTARRHWAEALKIVTEAISGR